METAAGIGQSHTVPFSFVFYKIKLFTPIHTYVSYSWPNGWTKLAEMFLKRAMGYLEVKAAKNQKKISSKFKISIFFSFSQIIFKFQYIISG